MRSNHSNQLTYFLLILLPERERKRQKERERRNLRMFVCECESKRDQIPFRNEYIWLYNLPIYQFTNSQFQFRSPTVAFSALLLAVPRRKCVNLIWPLIFWHCTTEWCRIDMPFALSHTHSLSIRMCVCLCLFLAVCLCANVSLYISLGDNSIVLSSIKLNFVCDYSN